MINSDVITKSNEAAKANLDADYDALGEHLDRRGIDIAQIKTKVAKYGVAVPSWGVGTGGTRFARFPGAGEPRGIFDKLSDCGLIQQLTRATPSVSLHIPWDAQPAADLNSKAQEVGLTFDAINSNTFQDQPDQEHSYKFGSLAHTDAATRQQAVDHNIACIELGAQIGSKALTIWVGDGSNFPGQTNFTKQFERYLDAAKQVYGALPDDWTLLTEHKMYEPAFYSTVVQDWGTNLLIAQQMGDKAKCLVDLGHHAPNVNIEMIVARLTQFGKLGGFHFNDSIDPYRLFLVFNELVEAETDTDFNPMHMLDQSHNVTDPIESLMVSATEVQRAYAQALLVDRASLVGFQNDNDALMATTTLKHGFRTDVEPILAMARLENGGAIDPVSAYRASGYRSRVAAERPAVSGAGVGII
jgi:L-rhamnose isomerase/sugar isomerase